LVVLDWRRSLASQKHPNIFFRISQDAFALVDTKYYLLILCIASEIDLSTQKIMEIDMRYQRIGKSATDALLTYWGHSNPTVAMLESALIKLNLHRAADVVRCPRGKLL